MWIFGRQFDSDSDLLLCKTGNDALVRISGPLQVTHLSPAYFFTYTSPGQWKWESVERGSYTWNICGLQTMVLPLPNYPHTSASKSGDGVSN